MAIKKRSPRRYATDAQIEQVRQAYLDANEILGAVLVRIGITGYDFRMIKTQLGIRKWSFTGKKSDAIKSIGVGSDIKNVLSVVQKMSNPNFDGKLAVPNSGSYKSILVEPCWVDTYGTESASVIYRILRVLALCYFQNRADSVFIKHGLRMAIRDCIELGLVAKNKSDFGRYQITKAGKDYMRKYKINHTERVSLELGGFASLRETA